MIAKIDKRQAVFYWTLVLYEWEVPSDKCRVTSDSDKRRVRSQAGIWNLKFFLFRGLDSCFLGQANQFGHRVNAKFFHDAAAVHFDRFFGNVQF